MCVLERLNALSDPIRLRILSVLERDELGVGELARVLKVPQSSISRHLKLLQQEGWLARRPAGTANLYRLLADALDPTAQQLWAVVRDKLAFPEDQRRLRSVLALRSVGSREFFGRHGVGWDAIKRDLFGSRYSQAALLGLLPPGLVVADLGCGTGEAVLDLAPAVRRVIAVDREQVMLDATRSRCAAFANVETRLGDLDPLPLATAEVDAALCMLVLQHVEDLGPVFCEIRRALRPAGQLVLLDLQEHDRDEYRISMGHLHQGFSAAQLEAWARQAGLRLASYQLLPPEPEALGPPLFVARLVPASA